MSDNLSPHLPPTLPPWPFNHYTTGGPRVHATTPREQVEAGIEEYERRGRDGTLSYELSADLLECAADLREELAIREHEAAGGVS